MFITNAVADDKEALIALDKQWGQAVGKEQDSRGEIHADNSVSVDDKGMKNKRQQIDDIKPTPRAKNMKASTTRSRSSIPIPQS